jgi:signal transduction histidine kinase
MRRRNSLRIKVARAFGILVAAISLAWATVVISGVRLTEDRVLVRQLRLVAEDYALRFSAEGGELAPEISNFQSYDQVEKLPPELADWANETPDAGYYEFQEQELHVAVLSAGEPSRRLYIVFDVAGIEAASSEDFWWFAGLTSIVILLTLVAIGLGTVLSRRVIEPVTRLADVVGTMNPEQLSDDDWRRIQAADFPNDEVGLLARTIEKTLQRICAFVEREKYFTSAASHELRTPVTVMSGALELLENSSLSNGDARAVARIKRATNDMRTTIEMFLCLSRESAENLYGEHFLVAPVVDQAIDQHRHLLENKNIKVDLELSSSPEVFGHPQAFAIAVNNLVRNAFEHSPRDQGPITVRVDQLKVSVRNRAGSGSVDCDQFGTRRASQPETSGFGLGLDIVRRLCEHNGWIFHLRASADLVDASLSWSPQRLQPAN